MMDLRLPVDDDALLSLAGGPPGDPQRGLFDDDAPIRRWSRENAVVMGGGCALLLEVAHPLVAAGVAHHSDFRSDPFGRLQRTLAAMGAIVFGSAEQAVAAARRIDRAHAHVRGRLVDAAGPFAAGTPYSGRSPALVAWVWATLAWTTVRVHERLLGPPAPAELEAFHLDQARVARLLGLPPERVPTSRAGFLARFEAVRRDQLHVTPEARAIARALFAPGTRGAVAGVPGAGLARALATSLLPQELRQPFGLGWTSGDEERLERFLLGVRRLRAS
jgi:uncharacterized protein (DUF2236 family)